MNWNAILGVACVASFTFPVAVILYNRYYIHRSLAALLIYYSLLFFDNFFNENYFPSSAKWGWFISLIDNYAYVPLVLTALFFFYTDKQKQKKIRWLTYLFMAYEIVIISMHGFTFNSIVYILGPGIGILMVYSFYLFVRQVKFSIYHGKNYGHIIMLASVFLDSSCFGMIYFFNYILKTPFQDDVFVLYYISSIVSSALMALGLHMMKNRMKELRAIRTTRKELAMFFEQ